MRMSDWSSDVCSSDLLELPTLEPRGAVMAELLVDDRAVRVIGLHLDLSGLWRRRQMRAILGAIDRRPQTIPTVLMGDTNEWRTAAGCLHSATRRVGTERVSTSRSRWWPCP